MNFAALGPPVPTRQPDPPVVRLLRWAVIAQEDAQGNVVVTFRIRERDGTAPVMLLLSVEPYGLTVQRCIKVTEAAEHRLIRATSLPGHLVDLAKTKVRELYHRGFPQGFGLE